MKIAIVINTSWNIYNFRMCLVDAFLKEGHEVIAIAPQDEYSHLLEEKGCKFIHLEMNNKGMNPLQDLKLILTLKAIYKKVQPDVILQYTIKPNIYGSVAAYWNGIPTICNVSGLGTTFLTSSWLNTIAKKMYRYAFNRSNHVFFQNPDDQELFLELGLVTKDKTSVLPGSGIDLQKFKTDKRIVNSPRVFVFIARLLFAKGIQEYLETALLLKEQGTNIRLQICGAIEDNAGLGITKEALNVYIKKGVIEYLGKRDDIINVINDSDCVVLPSYREGTPRSLIESIALSKPIITTDVAGCKEVYNGKNGLLFKGQSVDALTKAMLEINFLPEAELLAMGKESRVLAETKFNEKIVVDNYKKIIKLCVKK